MSVKKQLLDPLATICKLVSLNFSGINTKISIQNHVLSLQKPDDYQIMKYNYQFLIRMVNGDGKENVSELFYVIIRVIKWYLVSSNETDGNSEENYLAILNSQEIKRLIKYACHALKKLQETYEYGNVILAIQFYINILDDAVNGNYNDAKLPKYILDKEREFENLLDYDKLKNFWDYKKLKRICDLYDNCFSIYNDQEINNSEKGILIDGQLKIVKEILELADLDFQKLIQNSNKG